jgi:CRISPR-associated protein Csx10
LTLTADLLLRDRLLRWRLRLDEQVLADAGLPDATLVYHAASVRRVLGWNGLLGLPREDALAIGMGSVFLFRFPNPPALAALYHLEANGLGERTVEGFGRLTVADPFPWEVNEA